MLVQRLFKWQHTQGIIRYLQISRCEKKMLHTNTPRPNHMERTASSSRSVTESSAVVKEIKDISPTVKYVCLGIHEKNLTFSPGQWVDFHIPGVETVGGYSMCSAPKKLAELGELDLSIKFSSHPPAHWVHTQCKTGQEVMVRVGGDFFYSPPDGAAAHSLLLLAGGVGINPLYSIMQHAVNQRLGAGLNVKVSLLYSSKTSDELIFRDEITELISTPGMGAKFFVTEGETQGTEVKGRIGEEHITGELNKLKEGGTAVSTYICGPGPMIDSMENILLHLGQAKANILYEKWW